VGSRGKATGSLGASFPEAESVSFMRTEVSTSFMHLNKVVGITGRPILMSIYTRKRGPTLPLQRFLFFDLHDLCGSG
jgi:hypothetical protein